MARTGSLLLLLAGLLVGARAAAAGMYSEPYALFEPHERSQVQEQQPAFIMSIDGKSRGIKDNGDPVAPGKHRVELSLPGPKGMSNPKYETLEVDAKPCVRYRFGARRDSPTARNWYATIESTEPIGECLKKFPDVKVEPKN